MCSEARVEVMGTTAHLIVTDGSAVLMERAIGRLHELEGLWSRFRPDSEITRLNERPGVPIAVSSDTYRLVELALEGARMTKGLFNPTLLRELCDAGYDRSFERVGRPGPSKASDRVGRRTPRLDTRSPATGRDPWHAIRLDPRARSVCLDADTAIDPGGIGKGLAADMVVGLLLAQGAGGALVSIGGDLSARGDAPERDGWVVAVADPYDPDRVVARLALAEGAVASSWRTKRMWIRDGSVRHHVIDPRTGVTAATGVAGVTVVSGCGWQAEVLAKAAFLAGADHAGAVLTAHRAAGVLFTDDGARHDLGDIDAYLV